MQQASTPTIVNIPLTLANTEYSTVIPVGARAVSIHLRPNSGTMRYSYTTGYVAAGTDKCMTIGTQEKRQLDYIFTSSFTIYFASGTTGQTAEVEYWL